MQETLQQPIAQIIREKPSIGQALYFLGVKFYQYDPDTHLSHICQAHGLDREKVAAKLELAAEKERYNYLTQLQEYPATVVVSYLRYAHRLFIKERLPYFSQLVAEIDPEEFDQPEVAQDLKFVFPDFAADFIEHIYEEEDTLFTYVERLEKALKQFRKPGALFYEMERHNLQHYALDHQLQDDEMAGIRQLTCEYCLPDNPSLLQLVVYQEFRAFEKELHNHARVENRILFPKALELENEVKLRFRAKAKLN